MDKLTVLLPVFNERYSITDVLNEWKAVLDASGISYRFLICEDGSTDGTKELLVRLKAKYNLILNQTPLRRGYGKAVTDGILTSRTKYTLCIDSDGQCHPLDFRTFWDNRSRADVLIGRRIVRADSLQRKLLSALFNLFFHILFPGAVHDPSAPFVLFQTKAVLPHVRCLTFMQEGFWWGFTAMCAKATLSVRELPIHHRPRLHAQTQVYLVNRLPSIGYRNIIGLIKLKLAR